MNFNDRNQIFRKSDPTYKNKKSKDIASPEDMDSIPNFKRKGASLARNFNRQDSLNNSGREYSNKRISVLESAKHDSATHTGGTKLMNFIKSSLNLSKSKSKSKININENRQSIYFQTSSKSEENINGFQNQFHNQAVGSRNIVFKPEDNTIYVKEYNNRHEENLRALMILNKHCLVQPMHPSIAYYQNFCFQIIKRANVIDLTKPFSSEVINGSTLPLSQISKSVSYNSSFCSLKTGASDKDSIQVITCGSEAERNAWITKLKKYINPNYENSIRHEDLFKIWIQEAKNLILKKRYYCEIKLDNMLYGRTSIKTMNDMVFWGEEFEFRGLQSVNSISISLYRITDNKKKHEKSELVAQINIPCSDFIETSFIEKWYSTSAEVKLSNMNLKYPQNSKVDHNSRNDFEEIMKNVLDFSPMVRIKARYRPLEILPTVLYQPFSDFLVKQSISLVESLESHLKVKSKEDFVKILLLILENKNSHLDFLSDLVMLEVSKADDNLILRGNSIASKAMEYYMKMVGEKYLASLLTELIDIVTNDEVDCEVDPLRFHNPKDHPFIIENQNKLEKLVENVWNKIYNSSSLIPKDLKTVFSMIRKKLSETKRASSLNSPMVDQVISSCLFLRFICPAIMSPFLFGLANEYSDKMCINRTFTLVAKSIQSLANFSQFPQCKEGYMGFMQYFINKNSNNMKAFLKDISTVKSHETLLSDSKSGITASLTLDLLDPEAQFDRSIDIGYHLAELSFQLNTHLKDIPDKKYTTTLIEARNVLAGISNRVSNCDSETSTNSSNLSTFSGNVSSRIPTLIVKPDNSEIKNKIKPSKNNVERNQSIESIRRFSLPKKKSDVEENFSYIPVRSPQSKTPTGDRRFPIHIENYVDFEQYDSTIYDEPYTSIASNLKIQNVPKCLNEVEINDDWKKMVDECCQPLPNHTDQVSEYFTNYTITSSGYQSLTNFSPDDLESYKHKPQNNQETYNNEKFNHELACSLPTRNSPKAVPIYQKNNLSRLKKNSPINNKVLRTDTNILDKIIRQSPTFYNQNSLSLSRETLDSLEKLSKLENHSLSGSKSMLSLYQKKHSESNTSLLSTTLDKPHWESRDSSDCSLSSRNGMSSISLQSFANSIAMNVDLDPIISNEWKRIKLLLELFNIKKPSLYSGTAIEQYKQRTIDENCLLTFLDNKSQLKYSDIMNYLPAAYRLLKSIHKQGKIPADTLTNYLLNANQRIQITYVNPNFPCQSMEKSVELNGTANHLSTKPKSCKVQKEPSNVSTQSLPFFSTKYSAQSQTYENINKF